MVPADRVVDGLVADANHLAELDYNARSQRVGDCANSLEGLRAFRNWHLFLKDPAYYQDDWNGPIQPDPDNVGNVFSDSYVMPQYLRALAIYIRVIRLFFPNTFIDDFRDELRRFTGFLESQYNTSVDGIRMMALPIFWDIPFSNQFTWKGEMVTVFSVPADPVSIINGNSAMTEPLIMTIVSTITSRLGRCTSIRGSMPTTSLRRSLTS
jgi:hypothetical protein